MHPPHTSHVPRPHQTLPTAIPAGRQRIASLLMLQCMFFFERTCSYRIHAGRRRILVALFLIFTQVHEGLCDCPSGTLKVCSACESDAGLGARECCSCKCPIGQVFGFNFGWSSGQNVIGCQTPSEDIGGCEDVYDFKFQRCWKYHRYPTGGSETWDQAKLSCKDWGGHLASIPNAFERSLVTHLIQNHVPPDVASHADGVWIGTNAIKLNRHYTNLDGSKVTQWSKAWASTTNWNLPCVRLVSNGRQDQPANCAAALPAALCATPPSICPAGTYGTFPNCVDCPSGGGQRGTSVSGRNFGVYMCTCPEGYALAVVDGAPPQCHSTLNETSCNGYLDYATQRCWTFIPHSWNDNNVRTQPEALAACRAWDADATLPSVRYQGEHDGILRTLYAQSGSHGRELAWLGGYSGTGYKREYYRWIDGWPFDTAPWEMDWYHNFLNLVGAKGVPGCTGMFMKEETRVRPNMIPRACDLSLGNLNGIAGAYRAKDGQWTGDEKDSNACAANFYGKAPNCHACPGGGTSVQGLNSGILACTCPPGQSLLFNDGSVRCEADPSPSGCNGVWDNKYQRCWTLLKEPETAFNGYVSACEAWGGHLAAITNNDERLQIVQRLINDHNAAAFGAVGYGARVWFGASSPFERKAHTHVDGSKRTGTASWWGSYWDNDQFHPRCQALRKKKDSQWWPWANRCSVAGLLAAEQQFYDKIYLGALCATKAPLCPAGQYGYFPNCHSCPSGGTSTAGVNFGVYSCTCPAPLSLAHNHEGGVVCRSPPQSCDGIWDFDTFRCWKYISFWGGTVLDQSESESECHIRKMGSGCVQYTAVHNCALYTGCT